MATRLAGYYWVKWRGAWIVAFWNAPIWHVPDHDFEFQDSDFWVITQERLKPPTE